MYAQTCRIPFYDTGVIEQLLVLGHLPHECLSSMRIPSNFYSLALSLVRSEAQIAQRAWWWWQQNWQKQKRTPWLTLVATDNNIHPEKCCFPWFFQSNIILWEKIHIFFPFLAALHCVAYGISVPQPGIEPGPRQWKRRILTTRPPGNSSFFLVLKNSQFCPPLQWDAFTL